MKILLSNDDGIMAEGLSFLSEMLREMGNEVHIVAPERQQSGQSHAITLATPLMPKKIYKREKYCGMAVNGTPTDAVRLGVTTLFPDVDAVIAGMNLGNNLGPAIYYSGTIAAAFEGFIAGKPALAFSLDSFNESHFVQTKTRLRPFMSQLLQLCQSKGFYNINVPSTEIKGVKVTRHYRGWFVDKYEKRVEPRGREYYWLSKMDYSKELATSLIEHDLDVVRQGYISVTPLQFDVTNYEQIPNLQKIFTANTF